MTFTERETLDALINLIRTLKPLFLVRMDQGKPAKSKSFLAKWRKKLYKARENLWCKLCAFQYRLIVKRYGKQNEYAWSKP